MNSLRSDPKARGNLRSSDVRQLAWRTGLTARHWAIVMSDTTAVKALMTVRGDEVADAFVGSLPARALPTQSQFTGMGFLLVNQ